MAVSVEKLEKNVVEMEITIDAEKFDQAITQAAKKVAREVNIPGFRKGKAPRKVLELHLGKETLYNEAMDSLMAGAYADAVTESDIIPVDKPEIEIVQAEEGKDLIFKAKVSVKPEVELGVYKGLQIGLEAVSITDEQVDKEINTKQMQHARLLTLEEGKVETQDTVTIDYEGFIGDEAFAGGKGENRDLVIGSGTFIPGFEENLIGAETGQHVDVRVTFPEDYHSEDLAGKEAVFKTEIKKIKRRELSPLDDEFAKDVSEFETLDELKADIREKLIGQAEAKAKKDQEQAIIDKVAENAVVEIPEVMVETQVNAMVNTMRSNLENQGISVEDYLRFTNSTEEELKAQLLPKAEKDVRTDLILEAIGKAEGIEATEEEIDDEMKKLGERFNQEPDSIKQILSARGELEYYKQNIIADKTVVFLVEQNS